MKVKHLLHCHLLVTGMFPQMAAVAPRLPSLESLLTFSRRREISVGGAEAWLCHAFGVVRQNDWPAAPFAVLGEGLAPGSEYWLHADPVHFHLLRDRFTVADCVPFDLAMEETLSLIAALNQHFADDGLQFFAPHANRWYLRLDAPSALKTQPLAEVIGKDVNRFLPQGADAMKWHGWLNEAQMLLHDHPVNLEREHRGELPVNSIWPWGGGVLPQPALLPFTDVWADEVLVRGLMQASGREAQFLPFSAWEWLEEMPEDGTHLIVLDDLEKADLREDIVNWREALERLERHWFTPLLESLKHNRVSSVHLHLAQQHQVKSFVVERSGIGRYWWNFWRRPKPLETYLDG